MQVTDRSAQALAEVIHKREVSHHEVMRGQICDLGLALPAQGAAVALSRVS